MWSKLDFRSKQIRGPVNVITPTVEEIEEMRSRLGVKDDVGVGEERGKG